MNRLLLRIISVTCALFLLKCVDMPLAGGGSDLPDMSYSCNGLAINSDSTLVASVEVLLREVVITSRGDSIVREISTLTGNDGSFNFSGLSKSGYVLYSKDSLSGKSGVNSRVTLSKDSPVNNRLILSKEKAMRGRVLGSDRSPLAAMKVTLTGTGRQCLTDSLGFYLLNTSEGSICDIAFFTENIANVIPVVINGTANDSIFVRDIAIKTSTGDGSDEYGYFNSTCSTFSVTPVNYDDLTRPAWYGNLDFSNITYFETTSQGLVAIEDTSAHYFLLDDFEDGDTLSFLNSLIGCGAWYAYIDIDKGFSSRFEPANLIDSFNLAYVNFNNIKGQHVFVRSLLDTIDGAYTSVACKIGNSVCGYADLSKLHSISFYARGSGRVRVNFVTQKVIDSYIPEEQWGHLGSFIELSDMWTRVQIDTSLFKPAPGSPQETDSLSWISVRDSVSAIVFGSWDSPGAVVEMYLDEIYLHGINADDFK